MSRITSMLVCSSLGLVLGAGVASAYIETPNIKPAQQALQAAIIYLQSAEKNSEGSDKTRLRKALAYLDLAQIELDGPAPLAKPTN